jgi:mucin-19
MTINVANVTANQTFGSWLTTTNILARVITQNTVTLDSTSGGSKSTGNGYVIGSFGANNLYVGAGIAGGNLTSNSTLNLIGNIAFQYNTANLATITSNSTYSNLTLNTNTFIANTTGNISLTSAYLLLSTSNAVFSNSLSVNGSITVANTIAVTGNATFSNTLAATGNATFSNNVSVAGSLSSANLTVTTNTASFGNSFYSLSNGSVGIGTNTPDSTLKVVGTANITGNSAVGGYLNIANGITVSNTLSVNSSFVNVTANMSIGGNLNVTGNLIYTGVSSGNMMPISNNSYYLGNTSLYWNFEYVSNLYTNNITVSNTFTTTGNATFSNVATFNGNVVFSNNTIFNTNPTVNGSLTVTGNASVSGSLTITNFTANNITATSNLSANGVFILNQVSQSIANSYTFSNTTTPANVDIFSASSYRSLEYLVQLVDSSLGLPAYHITKILVVHDNVTTYMTEYGTIFNTQNLGTFTTGINAGSLFLQLTPTTANVVCKFVRTAFTV